MKRVYAFFMTMALAISLMACTGTSPALPDSADPQPNEQLSHLSSPRQYQSMDEMISVSRLIVVGTIQQVLPGRLTDIHSYPVTQSVLRVEQVIKGDIKTPTILVQQPGGVVNGKDRRYRNLHYYQTNDRYLLFLSQTPHGPYQVISWLQCEYLVSDDAETFTFEGIGPEGVKVEQFTIAELPEWVKRLPNKAPVDQP